MIGSWEVFLYDKADAFVAELPFENIHISEKLNDIPIVTLSVNYLILSKSALAQKTDIPSILYSGFRWVDIKRNGTTFFRGILAEMNISKAEYDININLTFKGWLAYFQKRFISKDYTATDAGAIAWDMIDTAQAETDGSIGITEGSITATKDRNRSFDRQEIAKSIINMGSQNIIDGYEFEITNDKQLTVAARIGSDKPQIVFDKSNIKLFKIDFLVGLGLVTQTHALGDGVGDDQLEEVYTASSTYTDKWYLLEEYKSYLSVKETATLQEHAEKNTELLKDVTKLTELTTDTSFIDLADYSVGDGVKVNIEDLIDDVLLRIKEREINIENGNETVKLMFL